MRTIMAGLIAVLSAVVPSGAQDYPEGSVTIVIPLGKGTTGDIIVKAIADKLSIAMARPVKIELKPGAGGALAMEQVEHSKPDGLTIGMITQGTHVFNLSLYKKLRYDPQRIVPVTPIATVMNVMTVNPANPASTPLDVAAAARAAPGKLTFSSGGIGTSHHLGGVLFASMTGVDIKHLPFLISVDGIQKIVSGDVTMGFYNLPTVIELIKQKRLKPLAVTSLRRSPYLPDVPTFDASGLKGYDLVTWFGFGVPAGTPPALVQRLRDDIAKVAADPDVKAKFKEAGIDAIEQMQPAAFARFISADLEKWTPIIKAAGAVAD